MSWRAAISSPSEENVDKFLPTGLRTKWRWIRYACLSENMLQIHKVLSSWTSLFEPTRGRCACTAPPQMRDRTPVIPVITSRCSFSAPAHPSWIHPSLMITDFFPPFGDMLYANKHVLTSQQFQKWHGLWNWLCSPCHPWKSSWLSHPVEFWYLSHTQWLSSEPLRMVFANCEDQVFFGIKLVTFETACAMLFMLGNVNCR